MPSSIKGPTGNAVAEDQRKRVLVVDDASLVRLYYRSALEGAGFYVGEALNGIEALEHLLAAPYDLLVVDVNMPQMDGLTFLKALRGKSLPMAAIPALVTSTEADPLRVAAARAAGANFYIVKPLSQETLLQYALLLCGAAHG
jgi:two-component system chemotaxis response regulator CheY